MNTILEQYKDKINGTFSFFDRIIIKGHIFQLFSLSGPDSERPLVYLTSSKVPKEQAALEILEKNPVSEGLASNLISFSDSGLYQRTENDEAYF